jgi:hypothetical protein
VVILSSFIGCIFNNCFKLFKFIYLILYLK